MSDMKRCAKCGKKKPATTEYFCPRKRYAGGLESQCKACKADEARAWRAKHKREEEGHGQETKKHAKQGDFIGAWCPPELKSKFAALAKQRGVTQSELLRSLIDELLEKGGRAEVATRQG